MANKFSNPSILLIDDNQQMLENLQRELKSTLKQENVDIRNWVPNPDSDNINLFDKFMSLVDDKTVLVATDYDLTSTGMRGFFGDTIVRWCKKLFIPVGDFSRANATALPEKPELFELRIPANDSDGARFLANTFHGFSTIHSRLSEKDSDFISMPSLSAVLAELLGRPHLDGHFALYMSRIVMNSSELVQSLSLSAKNDDSTPSKKIRVITYLLGHVLFNAILRYPGPILSKHSLCAYLAASRSEAITLSNLFQDAVYKGPFGEDGNYFWLEDVDSILGDYSSRTEIQAMEAEGTEAFEEYNRNLTEKELGRKLKRHNCNRCNGITGGFYCPFTDRTVCQRADCSESSSSWIPHGADLCRVNTRIF